MNTDMLALIITTVLALLGIYAIVSIVLALPSAPFTWFCGHADDMDRVIVSGTYPDQDEPEIDHDKVEVSRTMVGIAGMQVCAESDATDEEILDVCNSQNPAGTSGGWQTVVRIESDMIPSNCLPINCEDYEGRIHFLVLC